MKIKRIHSTFSGSSFDLNNIKFNPALVYGFQPEGPSYLNLEKVQSFIHSVGQYLDVYHAYVYAGDLLTVIQKTGIANVTSQQILEWIDHIHFHMAASLAEEFTGKNQDVVAGQHTKRQVFRFHHSIKVRDILGRYIAGFYPKAKTIKLLKEEGIEEELAIKILQFFLRICEDDSIEIPNYEKPYINFLPECVRFSITNAKLGSLYHNNLLSSEEKEMVGKIVKICTIPTKLPEVRQKFAEDIITKWQACDPNDINSIAELAFMVFYRLTEEHWYFNGNGRTATCFMNIILCSLGQPSILIRHPGERDDPLSNYSQAIEKIDTVPELLLQHIKKRIEEAKKSDGFEDRGLAETVTYQIEIAKILFNIQTQFPEYKINDYFDSICKSNQNFSGYELVTLFKSKLDELKTQDEAKKIKISPLVYKQYTNSEIKGVTEKLAALTGENSWKTYRTNGLTVLLEMKNRDLAVELIEVLNKTGTLQAKLKKNPTNQNPVVYIDSINYDGLNNISMLSNFSSSQEDEKNNSFIVLNNK